MLKAIHAQEDLEAARVKAVAVVAKLREMKLRTNNPLERVIREIRRRTRVVGSFPDGNSALMLAAARLRHIAGTKWGTKRCMDMNRLRQAPESETTKNAA